VTNKTSSFTQKKYHSSHPLRRFFISLFLKRILSEIKNQKVNTLLDIGCGEGQVGSFLLAHKPDLKITGIDFDEGALRKAKINCPGMTVKKADIYHLPFLNKSFNLILCLEVLEHLDKPALALKEFKRVGQRFLISVPHEPFFSLASFFSGKYLGRFGKHPEHLQFWSEKGFEKLLRKYFRNFKIKKSFPWLIAEGRVE